MMTSRATPPHSSACQSAYRQRPIHADRLLALQSDHSSEMHAKVPAVRNIKPTVARTLYALEGSLRARPRFNSQSAFASTSRARIDQKRVSGPVIETAPFNHHV